MNAKSRIGIGAIGLWAIGLAANPAYAGEVTVKGAESLEISGYTQARFEYDNIDGDSVVNNSFFVKRSRIKLKAEINAYTWSELQVDFASSKIVKDAFVGIQPTESFMLQMGQFKKPFSQEELFSSSATPVIDRGLTNELTTEELGFSGRDQGLMISVKDKQGVLTGQVGVFSGAGESKVAKGDELGATQSGSSNRGKDFAARLALTPRIKTKLQIAANISAKSVGGSYTQGTTAHNSEMFTAFGGDLMIMPTPELTLYAEGITGDNFDGFVDTLSNFQAATFLGFHVAGFYHAKLANSNVVTAIQPEARVEMFDPDTDTDDDGSTLISAGLSLFFGKNVRWRNNVVIESFQASGIDSQTRFVSELMGKI